MNKSDYKQIAKNIQHYRNLRHLTQEQVAAKLDIDSNYYSKLEQGRRRFTLEKVVSVCQVLQVTPDRVIPPKTYMPSSEKLDKERTDLINEIDALLSEASVKHLIFLKHMLEEVKSL